MLAGAAINYKSVNYIMRLSTITIWISILYNELQ